MEERKQMVILTEEHVRSDRRDGADCVRWREGRREGWGPVVVVVVVGGKDGGADTLFVTARLSLLRDDYIISSEGNIRKKD